jgi:hypothetical protein
MTGAVSEARRIWARRDSIRPPAAPRRAGILTGVSLGVWAGAWAVGDRTVGSAVLLALAIGGAGAAAYLVPLRPTAVFGIIFLLASLSRFTVELPFGTMRMEHPAIAFAALALLSDRRGRLDRPRRSELTIVGLLGGYLAVLAVSSTFAAPEPVASLRIVAWTAISLVGGVVAYFLLRTEPVRAEGWYRGSAFLLACAGIGIAAWYSAQGPSDIPGMSAPMLPWRKVGAYAWEPNLYASFLAAMAPFAVERLRQRQTVRDAVVAAVILFAIGLGVTRGAYLGLVAGFAVYGILLIRRRAIGPRVLPFGVSSLATLAGVLLSGAILATPPTGGVPLPGHVPPIGGVPLPGGPTSSAAPGPVATLAPTPLPETSDTISHRLERVAPALDDLATSPWIGLGAASFGQRHADSSQGGAPDHIAILVVALFYEAGILGALFFSLAVGLLLLALIRASRSGWAMGLAGAYLAAIVTLLVAYQATNALVFGLNWLLGGAALALAARTRDADAPGEVPTAQVP